MKKLSKISYLVALLAFLAPISTYAGTPQAVLDYFDSPDASYIVKNSANTVSIVTWKWKAPATTCSDLKSLGVSVERVINYVPDGNNPPVVTYSDCES